MFSSEILAKQTIGVSKPNVSPYKQLMALVAGQ